MDDVRTTEAVREISVMYTGPKSLEKRATMERNGQSVTTVLSYYKNGFNF
jgi:hypothetical protein